MQQRRYIKLIIFSIILLFITAGCKEEKKDNSFVSPFIGGNKGLIAEFEEMGFFNEKSGMEEIFEGEAFPIEVVLKNKGEHTNTAGMATVTLLGININDFTGIVSNGVLQNIAEIEKISEFNKEGGEIILDFTSGNEDAKYKIPLVGLSYDISVFANVVYEYKTYAAVPKVCFKGNLNDPSVCEVEEIKDVFSSGAPIQVQSAEEKRAGTGRVSVEFKIENVGTGKVTKPGANFDPRYDQLSYTVSDANNWDCRSSGRSNEARLDENGKATIICKWDGTPLTNNDLYTKQLDLTLFYKYKELVHKQLRIKKQ